MKCDNPPYDKLLENLILKYDYAKFTDNRLKNKGVTRLTQKEKVEELYEIMKDRTEIIRQKDKEILFSDGTPVGSFWRHCKADNRCDTPPYDKLLQN
jgi:hypothetical protein